MSEHALQEASQWVVRQSGAELDDMSHQQFRQWYQASPAHAAAHDRLHQLWHHMGEVDRRRLRKRSTPGLASAAFLACAATLVWWLPAPSTWQADYRSGQTVRSVALPDGSTAILDAESAIAVDFSGNQRIIRLLQGQAYVLARPRQAGMAALQVVTRDATATALGTRFAVQTDRHGTAVSVYEHQVALRCDTCEPVQNLTLEPGQRARLVQNQWVRMDLSPAPAPAWSQGLARFDNTALPEAAAELARYGGRAVVVLGAARELRVSGTVAVSDTRQALTFLLASRQVQIRSLPGLLIIQ